MFNVNAKQTVIAGIGALLLTAVSIGAAAGPARIVETSPVSVAQVSAPVAVQANV
ncbi:MAG TPA: hypothetical protein VF628_14135 [Allosphingosinicella sp.]|jgi:hypothetical protein